MADAEEQARRRNGSREELPDEMFLGRQRGEWPVQAFTSEAHAVGWLDGGDKTGVHTRRLWKVRLVKAGGGWDLVCVDTMAAGVEVPLF